MSKTIIVQNPDSQLSTTLPIVILTTGKHPENDIEIDGDYKLFHHTPDIKSKDLEVFNKFICKSPGSFQTLYMNTTKQAAKIVADLGKAPDAHELTTAFVKICEIYLKFAKLSNFPIKANKYITSQLKNPGIVAEKNNTASGYLKNSMTKENIFEFIAFSLWQKLTAVGFYPFINLAKRQHYTSENLILGHISTFMLEYAKVFIPITNQKIYAIIQQINDLDDDDFRIHNIYAKLIVMDLMPMTMDTFLEDPRRILYSLIKARKDDLKGIMKKMEDTDGEFRIDPKKVQ
ncbi:MAG: hypothetical protein GY804_09220 [Alphaproteobacteria bacterium]|nr:hypothetical protein [Alphaproteobacteria bacterium]